MKRIYFSARLLSDAVISERAATTGGHRSLDYIPGATLLGAAAARLYKRLGNTAFDVFHSGRMRFSNAYPLDGKNRPSLPVPLAWHYSKGDDPKDDVRAIKNLLYAKDEDFARWDAAGEQQKQMRGGYFTADGSLIKPALAYRLKTAIDRANFGMSAERQLFGYQALKAGSGWHFSLAFDDGIDAGLIEQVADALCGDLRIGRSRSAEYGLLRTQRVAMEERAFKPSASQEIVLYCVSDLALQNPLTGVPVLIPEGVHFGLEEAIFQPERSFLRVRSYAPFNAKRLRFDLERQVIAKGSVLGFQFRHVPEEKKWNAFLQRLEQGVGLYRQDGLGRILVNPAFLAEFEFTPEPAATPLDLPEDRAPKDKPELARWLEKRANDRNEEVLAILQVEGWIDSLVANDCPKNSQWGNLRNAALRATSVETLRAEVDKLCGEGVSKKQWSKSVRIEGEKISYLDFLQKTVLDGVDLETARKRLFLLGNRVPRRINRKKGGEQ